MSYCWIGFEVVDWLGVCGCLCTFVFNELVFGSVVDLTLYFVLLLINLIVLFYLIVVCLCCCLLVLLCGLVKRYFLVGWLL